MSLNYQIIFCTCPDHNSANEIATHLVTEKLAACVNILPAVTSVYEWQGKIESAQEQLLLIKSHDDFYARIETEIINLHPYELPEVVAVPMEHASPQYLQWINSCLLPE
ncbi:MAG: divalent cation tolerance protein CutA [Methylococcaceae bacterium]|nr:divalent cation tolerance protein CutA [Methylococcaceae bacterium]